jgi:deoxyribonuclease-4
VKSKKRAAGAGTKAGTKSKKPVVTPLPPEVRAMVDDARAAAPADLRLGAHMSSAGGVHNALLRGREMGCDVIQLFSKQSNQWKAREFRKDELTEWFALRKDSAVPAPELVHDSYLINLAAPEDDLFEKSIDAFAIELGRCAVLQTPHLVMHPGAHKGMGEDWAIDRLRDAFVEALERCAVLEQDAAEARGDADVFRAKVLIETTAGMGTTMGYVFSHIRDIIAAVSRAGLEDRFGVCLDTCHIFAAGYDIRTAEGWHDVMREFDETVGLHRLSALHLNDSKVELASRKDRHEHIGQGKIGEAGFRAVMQDQRLHGLPMSIETPKEGGPAGDAGEEIADAYNLSLLRDFASGRA